MPAKFPIAKEPAEAPQIDFSEFVGWGVLHMQEAIASSSVLKRTGPAKGEKKMECEAPWRLAETAISGRVGISGGPRIVMGDTDARFTSHTFERFCAVNHISFLASAAKSIHG